MKLLIILKKEYSSLFLAALCSLFPIVKIFAVYKLTPSTELDVAIYYLSVLAIFIPISQLGVSDYFLARASSFFAKRFELYLVSSVIVLIFVYFISFFFDNKFPSYSSYVLLICADVALQSIFYLLLKVVRYLNGVKSFYAVSLLRALFELLFYLCLIYYGNFNFINFILASVSAVSITIFIISWRMVSTEIFGFSRNIKTAFKRIIFAIFYRLKDILFVFLGISSAVLATQLDRILVYELLSSEQYANYNYYSFSKNLVLSVSAFLFTRFYRDAIGARGSFSGFIGLISISKRISALLVLPMLLVHVTICYFFIGNALEIETLLISFLSSYLLIFFVFDLLALMSRNKVSSLLYNPVFLLVYLLSCLGVYHFGLVSVVNLFIILFLSKLFSIICLVYFLRPN